MSVSKQMTVPQKSRGDVWTAEHLELLRQMASERLPVSLIGKKLGRTEKAIEIRARKLGVALKKPGQSRLRDTPTIEAKLMLEGSK